MLWHQHRICWIPQGSFSLRKPPLDKGTFVDLVRQLGPVPAISLLQPTLTHEDGSGLGKGSGLGGCLCCHPTYFPGLIHSPPQPNCHLVPSACSILHSLADLQLPTAAKCAVSTECEPRHYTLQIGRTDYTNKIVIKLLYEYTVLYMSFLISLESSPRY